MAVSMVKATGVQAVTVACNGGTVVVLDDASARMLRTLSHRGWTEVVGMAHGYSKPVTREDSTAWALLVQVLEAVAVHSADESDRRIAARGLDGGAFYGYMVGASGWDAERRWWNNYEQTRDLHPCSFSADYAGRGEFCFSN